MTPLQLQILDEVRETYATLGISPTIQSLADQFGKSKSCIHRAVTALVDAGLLVRTPSAERGLRPAGEPDLRGVPTDSLHAELARRGVNTAGLNPRAPRAYGRGAVSCAADSCGAAVQRGHLFCREHWFSLPHDLRQQILSSFAAARRGIPGAATAYQEAVAEARDLIDGGMGWRRAS